MLSYVLLLDVLHRHQAICYQRDEVQVTIPDADKDQHIFNNINARWFVPRVIYFDLESLTLPVSGAEPDPDKTNTQTIEKHQNCGCGLAVVDNEKLEVVKFELKRRPDCIDRLLQSLETLAKEAYAKKRRHYAFTGKCKFKKEDTQCWICEELFGEVEEKVLDHCHHTDEFLGWAHNRCNINHKTTNLTSVVAHNLSNYDPHCIVRSLSKSNRNKLFSVIRSTEEKFIDLKTLVLIKNYRDKYGKL